MLPPLVAARRRLMEEPDDQEKWVYQELTRQIIGVCIEVIGELGDGFLERVYHSALPPESNRDKSGIACKFRSLQTRDQTPSSLNGHPVHLAHPCFFLLTHNETAARGLRYL